MHAITGLHGNLCSNWSWPSLRKHPCVCMTPVRLTRTWSKSQGAGYRLKRLLNMSLCASTLSSATHYRMGWYWPDKRLGGSFLKMKRTKPDGTISTICTYVTDMCQEFIFLHDDNKLQWSQKPLHILFSLQSTIFKESQSNQGSNFHFTQMVTNLTKPTP